MSKPKARLKIPREMKVLSSHKTPVIGLRPIKERNKRSEALIEEQLLFMKETQRIMLETLQNLEKAITEDDFEKNEEELRQLLDKSEKLFVIVQVLIKIRNELAYARLDLERAVKTNCGIDMAKKRVKWLQDRLEKVLLTARSYCHLNLRLSHKNKTPESGLKDQISEKLWNKLSKGQQEMLLESEKRKQQHDVDEATVTPILKEVAKMHLQQTESAESITEQTEGRTAIKDNKELVTTVGEESRQIKETGLVREKQKQRKRSDVSRSSADKTVLKSDSSSQIERLSPSTHGHDYHSDQETVTTAEPQSDSEEFIDDHLSDSMLSSVGAAAELDEVRSDSKRVLTTPLELLVENDDDDVLKGSADNVHELPDEGNLNDNDDNYVTDAYNNDDDNQDMVGEYWSSEHHKFEWSDYMQSLDPLSWHALGLGVPESFLSKDKPDFVPDLPWKEKPLKVNSVIDVHKIALDKLLLRLHKMYETIGQATQSTIEPATKDVRIETVMGKLEVEADQLAGSVMDKQQSTQSSISKQASRVSLPQIGSLVAGQKSIISMEKYPVTIHEPTAIRTARQNRRKLFPQQSTVWCEDIEGGYRIPQILKGKPKPELPKTKSLVLSSPKNLQKAESPKHEHQVSELDLTNKSIWKTSLLIKLVAASKVVNRVDTQGTLTDRNSPKWRRIENLLGEGGLMSPNPTIAAEAAKTIGLLKCQDNDVLHSLRHVIKLQRNAKVSYEASKALILLGTWDAYAMSVIIQYIKHGNKDIVLELLSTMTKARDVAFVDKGTNEFKKLVNLLIFTIKTQSPDLGFHAAVSLGRLCVVEPVSKAYLISRLPELTPSDKGEALYVLIKQMNCKEKPVIDALLEQLSTAYNWKLRMEATDLLIFIGARDLFKVLTPEEVFDILETLLWDHANKELRAKVSEALSSLDLRQRASQLVLRRLEDPAEEVRARAVISLATLRMKGVKEMKALLDILELDSSVYVRIQVVRAFGNMEWNDPRILRSLKEREKGEGTLATEARKTLAYLSRFPSTK